MDKQPQEQIELKLNAQQFKQGVVSGLAERTAFPVYVIWYDKTKGGWCKAISNELQQFANVKKQVGSMMWADIQNLKLLDGIVKPSG